MGLGEDKGVTAALFPMDGSSALGKITGTKITMVRLTFVLGLRSLIYEDEIEIRKAFRLSANSPHLAQVPSLSVMRSTNGDNGHRGKNILNS